MTAYLQGQHNSTIWTLNHAKCGCLSYYVKWKSKSNVNEFSCCGLDLRNYFESVSKTSGNKQNQQNHNNVQSQPSAQLRISCWLSADLACKMKGNQKKSKQITKNMDSEKSLKHAWRTPFHYSYQRHCKRNIQRAYPAKPVISAKRTNKKAKMNPLQVVRNHQYKSCNNYRQGHPEFCVFKNVHFIAAWILYQKYCIQFHITKFSKLDLLKIWQFILKRIIEPRS